jgi:hypothetical protein
MRSGARDRTQAVIFADENGLVVPLGRERPQNRLRAGGRASFPDGEGTQEGRHMRTLWERALAPGWIAALLVALVAVVVLLVVHDATFAPALDRGGPGIVEFELAGSPARATQILDGWGEPGRRAAVSAIGVDYAFLVAYSAFLALAAAVVAARSPGWWGRAGRFVPWLCLLAGAADAVENTILLRVIDGYRHGGVGSLAPALAADAARVKFGLILVVAGYLLVGLAMLVARRLIPTPAR